MNFHIGKIYKMPSNFYFFKANQPRLLYEYCKKVKIPIRNLDISCIKYCKNKQISNDSDDDSWIDIKKIL